MFLSIESRSSVSARQIPLQTTRRPEGASRIGEWKSGSYAHRNRWELPPASKTRLLDDWRSGGFAAAPPEFAVIDYPSWAAGWFWTADRPWFRFRDSAHGGRRAFDCQAPCLHIKMNLGHDSAFVHTARLDHFTARRIFGRTHRAWRRCCAGARTGARLWRGYSLCDRRFSCVRHRYVLRSGCSLRERRLYQYSDWDVSGNRNDVGRYSRCVCRYSCQHANNSHHLRTCPDLFRLSIVLRTGEERS